MLRFSPWFLPSQFPSLQKKSQIISYSSYSLHLTSNTSAILLALSSKYIQNYYFHHRLPNPHPHEFLVLYWKMLLTGLSASIPALKIYHPVWEFLLKRKTGLVSLLSKALQYPSSDPWRWATLCPRFLAPYHQAVSAATLVLAHWAPPVSFLFPRAEYVSFSGHLHSLSFLFGILLLQIVPQLCPLFPSGVHPIVSASEKPSLPTLYVIYSPTKIDSIHNTASFCFT